MGLRILLLLMAGLLMLPGANAQTYSCRDDQGELHFADSPARLPEGCQGQTRELKSDEPGQLNIVPATPVPPGSRSEFEQSVRSAEREQLQRQQQIQKLQQQAEELAKDYQDAVRTKRQALRSWSYSSREEINRADQRIAEVRKEKQQLLEELGPLRMSQEDEQKIRQTLDSIEAE